MALEEAGVKLIAQGASAFDSDLKGASAAVKGFGAEANKAADLVQDAAGRWRTASGRFASDAEKAAAGVDTIAPAAKHAGDATEQAGRDAEKAGHGFDAFSQIAIGALRQIGTIAVDAFGKAARAGADFLKDSVGLAGDFEAGMLKFQSVAGKDVDTAGLAKFHDLFIQIGKELPVSTSDVQKAAIEMVKGGIDPAIIAAGGLRQNIQFAAAAMDGDLVKAAEISSKILGGWTDANATAAQKADFLAHSTDMLTKAANASSTDVEGLSRGIFNAQGIAKVAGVSFDDLTTTLATLAPRFASSSEAGNSLKNMIARLQPTTDPAIDAMESLGLYTEATGSAFYDAQGNFVGFQKASQLLQDSLKGLTKEQQAATLQQIFGNDAMGSAAALADLGAAGYQNMSDALDKANGVQATAALTQAGFNTALDNAKGSVEALQITIGEALLPILTDLMNNTIAPAINTLTDMASALFGNEEAFNRLSPAAQSIVDIISALSGYFTAVVEDGDYLNDFLTELPGPIQDVVGGLGMLIASFEPLSNYIAAVVEDGDSLNDFLSDVPKPMQDVVKVAGQMIAAFQSTGSETSALGGILDDLSGIWDHLLGVVTDVAGGYKAVINAVLPAIATFIDNHGAQIEAFFRKTWDTIIEIVNLALEVYDSIVPPILHAIAGFIEDHGSEIQKVFSGVWDAVTAIVTGALETIKGVIKLVLDIIHGDWNAAWQDIKGIVDAQATAIGAVVSGFLNAVAGIFDTNLKEIGALWSHNWDMIVEYVSTIDWTDIGADIIAGILQGITGNSGRLFDTLKSLASDALNAAKEALGISSPSKEFALIGEFSVQGIMEGFSSTWPQLTELVGSLSDKLIDKMRDIGQDMQSAIADSFGATASIDRQMAKNFDRLNDVGDKFLEDYIQQSLDAEQKIAAGFADPAAGAAYFKMVSDNIFETAALRKKMNEAETQDEKDRLNAQLILISRAQDAEKNKFYADQQSKDDPMRGLADQINAVIAEAGKAKKLTDDQIKIIDMLSGVWSGLQAMPTAAPPMTPVQYAASPVTTQTSQTTTYNMPIYTNNTPGALQQSWAVLQASMP